LEVLLALCVLAPATTPVDGFVAPPQNFTAVPLTTKPSQLRINSEQMLKLWNALVSGCSRVTGIAVLIINHCAF